MATSSPIKPPTRLANSQLPTLQAHQLSNTLTRNRIRFYAGALKPELQATYALWTLELLKEGEKADKGLLERATRLCCMPVGLLKGEMGGKIPKEGANDQGKNELKWTKWYLVEWLILDAHKQLVALPSVPSAKNTELAKDANTPNDTLATDLSQVKISAKALVSTSPTYVRRKPRQIPQRPPSINSSSSSSSSSPPSSPISKSTKPRPVVSQTPPSTSSTPLYPAKPQRPTRTIDISPLILNFLISGL